MPSWSRTGILDRQPVRVFLKTGKNRAPGAQLLLSLSLCCWHSCPTFLLLLLFLYPTAHTLIHCSPLVIPCLQHAASINTWHSCPLCASHAAVLRRKFMEWLSQFLPFLQAFQRRGSCAYNMLERTFPWITFYHYGYHLQWDGRLQLDLRFWWT